MDGKSLESLSNSELRSALLANGVKDVPPVTASTRRYLLTKLQKLLQQSQSDKNSENGTEPSEEESPSSQQSQNDEEAFEGYFGVAGNSTLEVQLSPYYTTKSDAVKAIKGIPGARFKKFETQKGAEEFSEKEPTATEETDNPNTEETNSTTASEKANNFPSIKPPEISKFRQLIETGDIDGFLDIVWSNPRYLMTSSDAPEIIQEGCRYNALMCAVKSRQLQMCKHLLEIIQSEQFWKLVYPADSDEMRVQRKDHLLDLYLNMQDKYNNDTPLHFACKFGYDELVSFLLSFPATSSSITNCVDETPSQVICSRATDADANTRKKIAQLLQNPEVCYVSVLRSIDNCTPPQLCKPCTLEQFDQEEPLVDDSGCLIINHALAGPMSPSQAESLYKEWRSPRLSRERKADPERGLEKVGRRIAHQSGVGWTEYWDCLGCSCDLSKLDGQLILEEYLYNHLSVSAAANNQLLEESQSKPLVAKTAPHHHEQQQHQRDLLARDLSVELFTESCLEECDDDSGGCIAVLPASDSEEEGGLTLQSETQHSLQCDGPLALSVSPDLSTPLSDLTISGTNLPTGQTGLTTKETRLTTAETGLTSGETTTESPVDAKIGEPLAPLDQTEDKDLTLPPNQLMTPPSTERSNLKFLTGPFPTKLDYDMLLALCGSEVDPTRCPLLHDWLGRVSSYSEQEQKTWRTPKVPRAARISVMSPLTQSPSSHPLSPLVTHSSGSPFYRSTGTTPLRSSGTTPLRHSSVTPLRSSGTTPLRHSSATPLRPSGATPLRHSSVTPLRSSGTTPLRHSSVTPLRSSGTTPLRHSSVTPLRSSGATPLRHSNATPFRMVPIRHGSVTPLKHSNFRNK